MRKILSVIWYLILFCVMACSVLFMIFPILSGDLDNITILFNLFGTFLFPIVIILLFKHVDAKSFRKLSFRKRFTNIFAVIAFIIPIMAVSTLYYINTHGLQGVLIGLLTEEKAQVINSYIDYSKTYGLLTSSGKRIAADPGEILKLIWDTSIWIIQIMFYAMLTVGILLQSVREFIVRVWRFSWRYVTVYVVFQIIMFAITAAAGIVLFLLASRSIDGTSIWFVFTSFFKFPLKASYNEINEIIASQRMISLFAKSGTLVSGLTGA
ncbi:MAG: hypothetical protein Q4C52_13575, partial [Eubacteriales bacterium]|nr:hypothetical protein [Eubacteriales bacterium]